MLTTINKAKFKDNKLPVTNKGMNMILSFDDNSSIPKMINETHLGFDIRIFEIKYNINTQETYIDWSNGMTRFTFSCACKYKMEMM